MYVQSDGIPVIFDSGYNIAVMPHASGFINKITPVDKIMDGLGATAKVIWEGFINWVFQDDYEVLQRIQAKVYHVPSSKVRLFSPQ